MEFTYNIKENKKTNKDIDNNLSRCFRPFGSRVMVLSTLLCRPESDEECGIIADDKRSPQS